VTTRCNKDCAFCHYYGDLNKPGAKDMDLTYERFMAFLDNRLIRNALRICLYGGEPFLNKDLFRMIGSARKRGHLVTVSTNGLLIRNRLSELVESPPDVLVVSYYPEDRQELAEAIPLASSRIPVLLRFLLTRDGPGKLEDALELAATTGVRLVAVERVCPTAFAPEVPPVSAMNPENLEREAKRKYPRGPSVWWPGSQRAGNGREGHACRYFWNSLFVDTQGRISPCCSWPLDTYQESIFDDPNAWNSQRMVSLRKDMRQGDLPKYCQTCPALYDDFLAI
jgi:radical SAM protein with 4Fe4S-binding SPASM domain